MTPRTGSPWPYSTLSHIHCPEGSCWKREQPLGPVPTPSHPLLRSLGTAGPLPLLACFSRKEQCLFLWPALPGGSQSAARPSGLGFQSLHRGLDNGVGCVMLEGDKGRLEQGLVGLEVGVLVCCSGSCCTTRPSGQGGQCWVKSSYSQNCVLTHPQLHPQKCII